MKRKIILVSFCLMLFLIFTALGYAEIDPRYKADPWEHVLSPKPDDDQNLDFVLLAINPNFCLILTFQSKAENFNDLDKSTDQKSASSIKQGSLNRNETRSNK